jgi:hypothetical protein
MADEDRKVFRYHSQGAERFADPFAVHRAFLRALGGDADWVFESAQVRLTEVEGPDGKPVKKELPADQLRRYEAEEALAAAMLTALGLPAFDAATGKGVTGDEAMALLGAWSEFGEKNAGRAGS